MAPEAPQTRDALHALKRRPASAAIFGSDTHPNRNIRGPFVTRQDAVDHAAGWQLPGFTARVRSRVCTVDHVACRLYFVTVDSDSGEEPQP